MLTLDDLEKDLGRIPESTTYGRVTTVMGLLVECAGLENMLSVGARCTVITRAQGGHPSAEVPCEVVGFREGKSLLMPYADIQGIGIGCAVRLDSAASVVYPCEAWLGRVVNALGEPVDGLGPLKYGARAYKFRAPPPPAHRRQRIGEKIDLGVASINTFLTTCRGQRMGIFSGSGIGKSTLMAMIAKFSRHDVNVIGLIGERGREVQEFIHEYLGPEGMAKSVLVVATSDESALMRKQAAYLTLAISEYFRDEEKQTMCMIDSVTRFAMALREIGLSAGEPPTTKGYTPTVFSELPKLLERAGPGEGKGMITGILSVLVEGDDQNEPISDAVRGILDGHIVMDRAIAERGRFPPINILRSVSRTMPDCNTPEETKLIRRARALMSTYDDMAEMIRLGAYRKGSDVAVDEAIAYNGPFETFLTQDKNVRISIDDGFKRLKQILGM